MTRALELPRALLAGALIAASMVRGSLPLAAQAHPAIHTKADAMTLLVPESMQAEHREIHDALDRATKVRGSVGTAARELAKVLGPHFVREEQIALPPLGLLAPLARGEFTPAMLEVLPLTDSLRAELPRMLQEHVAIHAATSRLAKAARDGHNADALRVAEQLLVHAQSEEQMFYPAALLVGDVVRARSARRVRTP
jgi:hypothetical protein